MKTIYSSFFAIVLAFCITPIVSNADGLYLENGRYAGGPAISIELTQEQIDNVGNNYKPYMEIQLTNEQRSKIKTEIKTIDPPSKVYVVKPKDTEGDCTCGSSNIGILYDNNTKMELPERLIYSDEKAEKRKIID